MSLRAKGLAYIVIMIYYNGDFTDIGFIEDETPRKLLCLIDLFSDRSVLKLGKKYPGLFGQDFRTAQDVYERFLSNRELSRDLWTDLVIKKRPRGEVAEGLKQLTFYQSEQKHAELAKRQIMADYESEKDDIASYFGKIFGFSPPKKLLIILLQTGAESGSTGRCIAINDSQTALIGYLFSTDEITNKKSMVLGIILHELLHSLIESNGILNRKNPDSYLFEETLVDYFLPNGILSHRLKHSEPRDIDIYQKENIIFRPSSKSMSEGLLPIIKEYDDSFAERTIWEHLKKSAFRIYLNE